MKRHKRKSALFYLLILYMAVLLIASLVMWGMGSLITTVFEIDYNWTFMHGVVVALIYEIVSNLFKK